MLGNSISLQGISGQNIKVMIDGVPLIGREGGNIDLSQINLSSVERIEMIEGPMGVNKEERGGWEEEEEEEKSDEVEE